MRSATVCLRYFGDCSPSSLTERWAPFKSSLEKRGLEVVDSAHEADFFVSIDHRHEDPIPTGIRQVNRILVAVEPPATNPYQYLRAVWSRYGYRLALSGELADLISGEPIGFPMTQSTSSRRQVSQRALDPEEVKVGMLAANKNSLHPNSRYKLRRNIIRDANCSKWPVVLAGTGWRAPFLSRARRDGKEFIRQVIGRQLPDLRKVEWSPVDIARVEYLGRVESKSEFYSRVSICIVVENDPRYLSEKLSDAIWFGCLPVYVGLQGAGNWIPSELYRSSGPTATEVWSVVNDISVTDIKLFQERADSIFRRLAFLGQHFEDQSMERAADKVFSYIRNVQ